MIDSRITVIGSGHAGAAAAADLTLAGHDVILYEMPQFKENIDPIIQCGGIELFGAGRMGFAKIHRVTTDMAEAVKGAPIIMVAMVGLAYKTIANLAAPYLEDGQIVILSSGEFGSLEFKRIIKEKRPNLDIVLAETTSAPYGSRRGPPGKAEVTIFGHQYNLGLAALPAKHTKRVIKEIEEFYPDVFFAGLNVIEVGLSNISILLPGPVLLMTGRIELPGDNLFYSKFTPSILKIVKGIIQERNGILRVLGLRELYSFDNFTKMLADPGIRQLSGPSDMRHRFVTESCLMGLVALSSLSDLVGVPTPICKSIITLISEIIGIDCFKEGRNLDCLGISGLNISELGIYLNEG
jgi:opine dehydrogenase